MNDIHSLSTGLEEEIRIHEGLFLIIAVGSYRILCNFFFKKIKEYYTLLKNL